MEPTGGFLNGKRVELYSLGDVTIRTNRDNEPADATVHPMYVFRDEAGWVLPVDEDGQDIDAQHPIVDVVPGAADYTPFFEIYEVRASGAGTNEIKSRGTLLRAGFEITATGKIVNCPVIANAAEVVAPKLAEHRVFPVLKLWYRRYETRCLLLDGGKALLQAGAPAFEGLEVPVGDETFLSVPIHEAFVPRLFLFDQKTDAPGNILISAEPGNGSPYSPLVRVFDVRVPPDYRFCAFDALADVDASLIEARDPVTYWNLSLLGHSADTGKCAGAK
jgi:hypothetical protein